MDIETVQAHKNIAAIRSILVVELFVNVYFAIFLNYFINLISFACSLAGYALLKTGKLEYAVLCFMMETMILGVQTLSMLGVIFETFRYEMGVSVIHQSLLCYNILMYVTDLTDNY